MNKSELARLIHRLKTGQATEREKELLENYWETALKSPSFLDNSSPAKKEALKNQIYLSIRQRLRFEKKKETVPFLSLNSGLRRLAAAFLILSAFTAALYLTFQVASTEVLTSSVKEIHTKYGEYLTIILPDKSSVVLNGNSKLRYSENWSDLDRREVWIDGEGFFAVQHTKNHQKFIVHTKEGLDVEVLGTKFNVKSRHNGSEVLLTEGKVKLNVNNKTDQPVYLNPGELATVKENKLSKRVVKDKQYTSWVTKKLFFDKMPLAELAQILQDTYGLHVSIQNEELKDRQLSGEISSASGDDILFAIAETFNIQVTKKNNNTVIFSSK